MHCLEDLLESSSILDLSPESQVDENECTSANQNISEHERQSKISRKRFRSSQVDCPDKDIEFFNNHAGKKAVPKVNSKDCIKNNPKDSSGGLKLVDTQAKIESFLSTSSIVPRNLSCPKKEHCRSFNKTAGRISGKNLSKKASKNREKLREVMEIEVFMPVIDAERNTITYSDSNPVVKRYFVSEDVLKAKNNIHRNLCSAKKTDEYFIKKSYLSSKINKSFNEKPNKSVSKPRRKSKGARNISAKKELSAQDLKLSPSSEKIEDEKDAVEFQDLKGITAQAESLTLPGVGVASECEGKLPAELQNLNDITIVSEKFSVSSVDVTSGCEKDYRVIDLENLKEPRIISESLPLSSQDMLAYRAEIHVESPNMSDFSILGTVTESEREVQQVAELQNVNVKACAKNIQFLYKEDQEKATESNSLQEITASEQGEKRTVVLQNLSTDVGHLPPLSDESITLEFVEKAPAEIESLQVTPLHSILHASSNLQSMEKSKLNCRM